MFNTTLKSTLLVAPLAVLLTAVSFGAQAAPQTYRLDPTHTAVTWHVNHFGFSTPSGKFMNVDGTLVLDEANPAASSVKVEIKIADGKSGVTKLDEHLVGPEFFDVAKFPIATFTSTKVELTGKDTAKVTGDLTIHGITKPATLDVKLNKIGENFMKVPTAGFTASTTLKRSDFGMMAYLPNLGDDVKIDIESEANIAPAVNQ